MLVNITKYLLILLSGIIGLTIISLTSAHPSPDNILLQNPKLINAWVNLYGRHSEINISSPRGLDGANEMTWVIWAKQRQSLDKAALFAKYGSAGNRAYIIRTAANDEISVVVSADGIHVNSYNSSNTRNCGIRKDNEWTMIALVYDNGHVIYYRNGVRCDSDTTSAPTLAKTNAPLEIGGGNNRYFNGSIDEARIYQSAQLPEQILRIYNESQRGSNSGQSIPTLVYHAIDINDSSHDRLSPVKFQQQMQFLYDNGFTTITSSQFYAWKQNQISLPKKPVIIWFDDGWSSVYTTAEPIMSSYGFKGTVAVISDYANDLRGGPSYMHWPELINLSNKGWDLESHSVSHKHMLTMNESTIKYELEASKNNLTQNIGITPKSFVFPFSEANQTLVNLCSQYYELCWTIGENADNPGYNYRKTNGTIYLSLQRISINNDTTFEKFAGLFGKETNLVAQWNMNEGQGNIAKDSSGNGNTGKLVNGASWGP